MSRFRIIGGASRRVGSWSLGVYPWFFIALRSPRFPLLFSDVYCQDDPDHRVWFIGGGWRVVVRRWREGGTS